MTHQRVSVIICAYTMDRWDDINEAVTSLCEQTRPLEQIVLVIDHNQILLERARAHFTAPVLVVANEGLRGLSGARNAGVQAATGDFIGFLDDDAVTAPDWLAHLLHHCAAPDVLGVVCRVDPRWLGTRPRWFPEEYMWTVGCSYRGLPETVAEVRNVFGGSMLVKRMAFDKVGGFHDRLGRTGNSLVSCEDTEWCIRVRKAFPTHRFLIVPMARMQHKIPAARLTWGYFRRRCYAEGRSKAIVEKLAAAKGVLNTEREHVLQVLTSGVRHGLRDALLGSDLAGIGRAGAIVYGLGMASAGYLSAKMTWRSGADV